MSKILDEVLFPAEVRDLVMPTISYSDIEELVGWKKVPVTITYAAVDKNICNTVLCIVGKNTTYSGAIYIDNLKAF